MRAGTANWFLFSLRRNYPHQVQGVSQVGTLSHANRSSPEKSICPKPWYEVLKPGRATFRSPKVFALKPSLPTIDADHNLNSFRILRVLRATGPDDGSGVLNRLLYFFSLLNSKIADCGLTLGCMPVTYSSFPKFGNAVSISRRVPTSSHPSAPIVAKSASGI